MRSILKALAGVALISSAPAFAQAQAPITAGMQITDEKGGPVGTVVAVQGDNLKIKTDKHEAMLPKASFAVSGGKLLIAMTQAELDAAIEKSLEAANASISPGATVKGANGAEIGKIDSVTEADVLIALPSGKKVQISRSGARGNPDGTVTIGLTADQLEAQVNTSGTSGQ